VISSADVIVVLGSFSDLMLVHDAGAGAAGDGGENAPADPNSASDIKKRNLYCDICMA
jgi:hypothetical protein